MNQPPGCLPAVHRRLVGSELVPATRVSGAAQVKSTKPSYQPLDRLNLVELTPVFPGMRPKHHPGQLAYRARHGKHHIDTYERNIFKLVKQVLAILDSVVQLN